MFSRRLLVQVALIGACCAASIGQQSQSSSSSALREFPVVLQQSVEAGKTPVGTKIQAKLAVATLFHGILVPRNAVISGVIFESVGKSGKAPSRLGIRMENAKWKDESTCMMKAYLMPLYYAMMAQSAQAVPNASPDPEDSRTLNGPAQSSSPMSQQPFPDNSAASRGAIPDTPLLSSRPVSMKNVRIEPIEDGGVALVSEHANIKLHKMTTYILAAIDPPAK
jgi:hypothetical protein